MSEPTYRIETVYRSGDGYGWRARIFKSGRADGIFDMLSDVCYGIVVGTDEVDLDERVVDYIRTLGDSEMWNTYADEHGKNVPPPAAPEPQSLRA
jgi:hypothetical protein